MDVYRVSDGAYERNKLDFAAFEHWHDVLAAVSDVLEIPVENVILFREDGRQLDEGMFHRMWEQAGEWQGKREQVGGVYVFDREAFSADPEEWVKGLEEDVVLDIELPLRPLRSAHLANQTLSPFLASLSHIQALEGRLGVQRHGLRIAGGNLVEHVSNLVDGQEREDEAEDGSPSAAQRRDQSQHLLSRNSPLHTTHSDDPRRLSGGWPSFQHLVETELARELSLIGPHPSPPSPSKDPKDAIAQQTEKGWGMEQDMHVISAVEVHEVFRRTAGGTMGGKTQDKDKAAGRRQSGVSVSPTSTVPPPSQQGLERAPSVSQEKRKTLADYVNFHRMKTVRDNCRKIYDEHQIQYSTISNDVFSLQSATDQIARSIDGLEAEVEGEVVELVGHAEAIVDEARMLVLEDPDVHWQSLRALDATMRELVVAMTHLKNDFCLQLHIHLHSIAIQQSSIAHVTGTMAELENALLVTRTGSSPAGKTHPTGFTHLDRLRNMLSAYMTACVEILWRKQVADMLEAKSSGLTEALAGYLEAERRRRRGFEQGEVAVLPPDINVFSRHTGGSAPGAGARGTPDFEFTVKTGYEGLEDRSMSRSDVEALVSTVDALKRDPAIVPCLVDSPNDVLDRAVSKARNLLDDMDLSLLELESLWAEKPVMQATPPNTHPDLDVEQLVDDHAALQLSHARLRNQLDDVREGLNDVDPGLEAHVHALEQEVASLRVELNHSQNAHEQDLARIQQLETDRSQILKGLSDARNDEEDLAVRMEGVQAELEAVLITLEDVKAERDQLVTEHADQIETMVEARLSELQGDDNQLQEQNAALLDEMEKLKTAHKSQLDNLQNRHAREVDGLKAELGMAKVQLKESQKANIGLLQDLSDTKSDLAAAKEESESAGRFSAASIKLASKYHDCVARLHSAIQSSATISGSTSALLKSPEPEISSKETDDQAMLEQELGVLEDYDLDAFTDAVNRTMSLVKKWQKSCRSYRDRAKDKIAFSNFGKGDLALFLPTRNATAKSWAAFNVSSPHHFLHVASHPVLEEQVKTREWIVARITKIDVDVVNTTQRPDSNPYGLAEGITYYSLSVEPFTPSTGARLRRSSSGKMPAMSTPGALLTSHTSPLKSSDYFGPTTTRTEPMAPTSIPRDIERASPVQPRRPSSVASSQGSSFSKKGKGIQYGSATKATSTLAVSSPTTGVEHHLASPGEVQGRQRRSFTSIEPGESSATGEPVPLPVAQRPTMYPQLRPGSLSRRVASAADADPAAGLGQGALDILKRIEAERNGGEKLK